MAVDKRGRKLPKGIRQRYDGFEGRFMYKGKSYLVHGETITGTQKEMTDLRYKLEHGLFVETTNMTFNDWFTTWLTEYKKNRVKIGTYIVYQQYYDNGIRQQFGSRNIAEIKGHHIQKFYNGLVDKGYTISTIKIFVVILNSCLKQAMRNGIIERNPATLAELPKQKTEKATKKALTKEQQALFMEHARESYLYNLFAVMLRTGMRGGEIRGLKYTDVDKQKRIIHVQRTLKQSPEGRFFEDTPKTKTSTRDIPLTSDLETLLDIQKNYWNFKVEKIDRYLFCSERGEPLSPERVQGEIDRAIRRIHAAGYEFDHITPHVFRNPN